MMNDSQSINDILISFFQSAMTEKNITYYCYYTKKKAPLLNSAYKVSQLLNFELPYISDIINQQIK